MMMLNSLSRRLFHSKPKKSDPSLLAQFYYADVDLCDVAAELDSFDGRKSPAKCAALVAQLRQYQDRVLKLVQLIMEEVIPEQRASRDFRVKYPEDLIQDGLAGQLWFGAECLSAGSSILNREVESESMRPLAKNLTKQLDVLRHALRDQSVWDPSSYSDKIKAALIKFDQTFADFELSYVSAMVPVKTMAEYDMSQEVTVLFSETVNRALIHGLITSDMMEYCDPLLMFTIPRLAIVSGLVIFPESSLNPERKPADVSEMFRPFQSLLSKIRELLWTLSQDELRYLERLLCNLEESLPIADHSPQPPVLPSEHVKPSSGDDKPFRNSSGADLPTCSLFSTISNVNDFLEDNSDSVGNLDRRDALTMPVPEANMAQTGNDILWVGNLTFAEAATVDSDSSNNNIETSADEVASDSLRTNEPPSNSGDIDLSVPVEHASQSDDPLNIPPASSVIVNDRDSGVARLIFGNSAADSADAGGAEPPVSSSPAEHRSANRQPSSTSDQFVFYLPNASQLTFDNSDEDAPSSGSSEPSSDLRNASNLNVTIDSSGERSRVTVMRSLSHSGEARDDSSRVAHGEGELARSDTDSTRSDYSRSTSTTSASDSDSSLSSGEASSGARMSGRRIKAKTFLNEKSANLRKQYESKGELIQRLFICISGVADQLQSNFACDLRNILKVVFDLQTGADIDTFSHSKKTGPPVIGTVQSPQSPPTWVPDSEMDKCCSCRILFTVIRRRHHCRNCGLIFCARCSSNSAPLPNYGYQQAVRICNKCYVYRINPFSMDNNEDSYNSATNREHL